MSITSTEVDRRTPIRPIYREIPGDLVEESMRRAQAALLKLQHADGYWVGELQGDSILESEYLLMKFILCQEDDPELPLIANYLRRLQQPDGGWNMYPGGKADLSGTVKAYFALKLMGDSPDASHMLAARRLIHQLGGAEKCNTFSKFFFACLGQISFDACPSIPPEVVLLPKWFYFNLYHVSAWTRTMILPLGIVTTSRFKRDLRADQGIAELYLDRAAANRLAEPPRLIPTSWRQFFLRVDQLLKFYEHAPIESLRAKAMRQAEKWLLDHLDGSEGLGAIFPPMVYILIVMRILGYRDDHPRVVAAHKHLHDFFIREGDAIRIQPCLSPVWDTGIALHALAEADLSDDSDAAKRATHWLLSKECTYASDWKKNCPNAKVGGWFFEFENPHYPDVDDTAMVTMALSRLGGVAASAAMSRGLNWLLAMQNEDGGWAAFDKTVDRPILEMIPFADHNAMQDPSCPDITGRVLECLGHCGFTTKNPAVRRAIQYIKAEQDASGGWWGRWGVNFVYGTWQVLTGLKAVGEDMSGDYIRRAASWLLSVQKPDGSFGESCDSYEDPSLKGKGESTASQTAWGAMGLMAVFGADNPAIERAIRWLADHQAADGNWEEPFYTGTGFPKVFYLKYHLYRLYFPLTALARYRRLKRS
ncbi:MAG: squalene-hopene/tetraprenyl-beta-curcumene cyclase [Phycisphaerales bacterium]|jgi:squalene-hopene/tetraprenyl-beta-curcumene cyclase|nr:squalene-hopene/tetraprenyl-beta-curcumene cyclase [Phycisphaerales bacterium]